MKVARRSRLRVRAVGLGAAALAPVAALACGTHVLVGEGQSCALATDCQPGLACAAKGVDPKARTCTSVVTGLGNVVTSDGGADATPASDAGTDGGRGGRDAASPG
jgi:hypothetical protein